MAEDPLVTVTNAHVGSRTPDDSEWRFVEFFITIGWPVPWPEHFFPVAFREEIVDWMPVELNSLSRFLREDVAQRIIANGNRNFVTFSFKRFPTNYDSPHDRFDALLELARHSTFPSWAVAAAGDPIVERKRTTRIDTYETIIRAATCIIDDGSGNLGKALHDALDRCLDDLALIMESTAQTTKDVRAGVVTRASIAYPLVPAILFDPVTGEKRETGVQAGEIFPSSEAPNDLNESQMREVLIRSGLAKLGEPYAGIRQWQRIARRAFFIEGEYALAVVAAHTAGEMLFDAFLFRMAWEEITYAPAGGLTRECVVGWFSHPNTLRTRLCGLYHVRLKKKWACGEPGNPVHTWLEVVSKLRHKVVHAGYRPTGDEAQATIDSMEEIENFIEDLVGFLPNSTKYPFTAYMMLGPAGLERAGSFTRRIRETIAGEKSDWRRDFYDFRQGVVEEIWIKSAKL